MKNTTFKTWIILVLTFLCIDGAMACGANENQKASSEIYLIRSADAETQNVEFVRASEITSRCGTRITVKMDADDFKLFSNKLNLFVEMTLDSSSLTEEKIYTRYYVASFKNE